MKYPEHYQNTKQGRVVDGIFDLNSGTSLLYETGYDRIREGLEALRSHNPQLFQQSVSHMLGKTQLDDDSARRASDILNQHGVGLDAKLTQDIVKDWKKNSPSLSRSYTPGFMVGVIGKPIAHKFYDRAAEAVQTVRDAHPEFATALDKMLKTGGPKSAILPSVWYKHDNADDADKARMAHSFERAVRGSGITGLNFYAARDFVMRQPHVEADNSL